ncbi:MAG: hypothetical protein KC502_17265 [Myxococcales bacterium]|nr:hypothetical protein [Myxococcales bacterium]
MLRPACYTEDSPESVWRRVAAVFALLSLVCGSLALSGCAKSPVDQLIDDSVKHLEAAHRMMVDNKGNVEKLGIAIVSYRSKHKGEFRKLRLDGEKTLNALPEAERKAVMARAAERTAPLKQKIERAAKLYKQHRIALRVVRPLIVTATPRGLAKGQQPPWMPKMPKAPDEAVPGGVKKPPAHLMKGHGKTAPKHPGHDHSGHGHAGHDHAGHGHGLPPASTRFAAP